MLTNSIAWLSKLINFDSTSSNSNLALIEALQNWFTHNQLTTTIIHNQDKTKANLLATLATNNNCDQAGIIFSGHTDVVPVVGQNWHSDPFVATTRDNKIFGRGSADMKGFLAVALALLPQFKKMQLPFPLHFAFSYDEEVGCRGISSLIEAIKKIKNKPALCVVGEPTSMNLVVAHKGIQTFRCVVHGSARHSSLTTSGCNAIDYAAKIICFLRDFALRLQNSWPLDNRYDVPFSTISTDIIQGGVVHNMIPDKCEFVFEFRNLPEVNAKNISREIESYIAKIQAEMRREYVHASINLENISASPSFNSSVDLTSAIFSKMLSNGKKITRVAYATEAGYFEEVGIKTIICGPGSIVEAHQADEFIALDQLTKCENFLLDLVSNFSQ